MARYNKNRFGSIVLQDKKGNDFTITMKEQNEIKTLVKRANSKRTYYAKQFHASAKHQANMKGVSVEAYTELLNKKGFITEKYSTDFNKIKSKQELKMYLKELKTVTKKNYYNKADNVKAIRESMIKRAKENYNDESKPIIELVNSLSNTQLMSLYIHNDDLIKKIYDSPPGSQGDVLELATKALSDINMGLRFK